MKKSMVAVLIMALVLVGVASGASGWKVVRSKSASGRFTVTSLDALVKHPKGLAVRYVGQLQSGTVIVRCWRGASTAVTSKEYSHAGLYRLRTKPSLADSCQVSATGVSAGVRLTVQILKHR